MKKNLLLAAFCFFVFTFAKAQFYYGAANASVSIGTYTDLGSKLLLDCPYIQ
ncbi:hypothetical protein [Parasediminibacterium sp. JCM 36343]|uniref:hypothetical protein n=1 Tax=Parasediminibacterium sp. JCM 36343 TaxID=3374279 RepID=UPI0039793E46